MQTNKKRIWYYIGTFCISIIGLWLFLIGTAMISNSRIQENMIKSAYSYGQREAFAFCDGDKFNGIADNYADVIWLNVAWNMGKDVPVKASLDTKYFDGEDAGVNAGFYMAVTDDNVDANTDYTRYWHGTAGLIRLLHLFTDVEGIKLLGLAVSILLSAGIVIFLIKEKKLSVAVIFLLSLCGVEIWKIGLSMEYQPTVILSLLMSIFFLITEKKGNHWMTGLSVIGGVLTAFFDFLTTETMVLLLPLVLVVIVRSMDGRLENRLQSLRWLISCATAWGMSYVGTFLVKWTLATVFTGKNQFLAAVTSVEERVAGDVEVTLTGGKLGQSLYALLSNVSVLFGAKDRVDIKLTLLGMLVFIAVVLSVWFLFSKKQIDKNATLLLCILGSVVLLRYIALGNHSYLHCFFTYRGLSSTLLAILGILIINCQIPIRHKHRKK